MIMTKPKSVIHHFFLLLGILLCCSVINEVQAQNAKYGILGLQAPEWDVETWIDAEGEETQLELSDFEGKIIYLFTFQSWCPGCHRYGFPTLQAVQEEFGDNEDVVFLAVQTVFEGHRTNTAKRLLETQEKYDLAIPFGHDAGDASTHHRSKILTNYNTGGTPWVIIIDSEGTVMYNDFHIEKAQAVKMINALLKMKG